MGKNILAPVLLALVVASCNREPAAPILPDRPELVGAWLGNGEDAGHSASLSAHFGHDLALPAFEGVGMLSWQPANGEERVHVIRLRGVVAGHRVSFTTERQVGHQAVEGQTVIADYFEGLVTDHDAVAGELTILDGVDCTESGCQFRYITTPLTLVRQRE
jgi:hypothetical protein